MLDFYPILWVFEIGLSLCGIYIVLDAIRKRCKLLSDTSTLLVMAITISSFFFLSTIFTLLKVPTLKFFSTTYYMLSITGLFILAYRISGLFRQSIKALLKRHSFAVCSLTAFIFLVATWAYTLKPVLSFPSSNDGLFHLTYTTKILQTGYSDLTQVPISFTHVFGFAHFSFYPTFMHYFITVTEPNG